MPTVSTAKPQIVMVETSTGLVTIPSSARLYMRISTILEIVTTFAILLMALTPYLVSPVFCVLLSKGCDYIIPESAEKVNKRGSPSQGNRMKKIEKYVIIDKEENKAVKIEEVSYEEIF